MDQRSIQGGQYDSGGLTGQRGPVLDAVIVAASLRQLIEAGAYGRPRFVQAPDAAIDRDAIVRLVYRGYGTPLWEPVTPGNKLWLNPAVPKPPRSLERARELLKRAGFSWARDGGLLAPSGNRVAFSIVVAAGNAARISMATIVQEDLHQLGMRVDIVPLEFRAMVDRVTKTFEYEAALMVIGAHMLWR